MTAVTVRPLTPPVTTRRKRRRRAFSLNGLAIQLSAFALSFTLVALLVVSGSQAAFVEENQIVTNHVPLGLPDQGGGGGSGAGPGASAAPSATPTPAPTTEPVTAETPTSTPPPPVVELTDDDAGTALFTDGTVLAPGTVHSRCITVSYVGHSASTVRLYAAGISGTLAPYLDLVVELGPATSDPFGSCAGFVPSAIVFTGTLADFAAAHPAYDTGVPTWDPAAADSTRSFRFSLSVRDEPAAEGATTSFGFSWEARGDQ